MSKPMNRLEMLGMFESHMAVHDERLTDKEKTIVVGVIYNASVETIKHFNDKQQTQIINEALNRKYGILYNLFADMAIERGTTHLERLGYELE